MQSIRSPDALATIAKRRRVIDCIRSGIRDKRELENELGVSRQTVGRALSELSNADVISDSRNQECQLTVYGEFLYEEFQRLIERYQCYEQVKPLLLSLPNDNVLEPSAVLHSKVLLAERPAPQRPIRELQSILADAQTVRGFTPVVLPAFVDMFSTEILDVDLRAELVFSPDVREYLNAEYGDVVEEVTKNGNCTIYTAEVDPTIGVVVDGSIVWIGIYDDQGNLLGAIINDSQAAIDWAEGVVDEYRAAGIRWHE